MVRFLVGPIQTRSFVSKLKVGAIFGVHTMRYDQLYVTSCYYKSHRVDWP